MQGTAYTFGDNVNTDVITPSDYFGLELDEMAQHIFEPIRADFADEIGDDCIVVAGKNFGAGSARETAPTAMAAAGITAVVAESFARIFYRNAIAIGLPVVTCPDVRDMVDEGDTIRIAFDDGVIENRTTGDRLDSDPIPPAIQRIIDEGGLLEHFDTNPGGLRID